MSYYHYTSNLGHSLDVLQSVNGCINFTYVVGSCNGAIIVVCIALWQVEREIRIKNINVITSVVFVVLASQHGSRNTLQVSSWYSKYTLQLVADNLITHSLLLNYGKIIVIPIPIYHTHNKLN